MNHVFYFCSNLYNNKQKHINKSILLMAIFISFLINSSGTAMFEQISKNKTMEYVKLVCFTNKSVCFAGNYRVRGSGYEKLFVDDGLVCDERKS